MPPRAIGHCRTPQAGPGGRVVYRHERVVLRRHGKRLLAMVPLDDLALLEAIEDRRDVEAAQKALNKPGRRNWHDLKKDLGL